MAAAVVVVVVLPVAIGIVAVALLYHVYLAPEAGEVTLRDVLVLQMTAVPAGAGSFSEITMVATFSSLVDL